MKILLLTGQKSKPSANIYDNNTDGFQKKSTQI